MIDLFKDLLREPELPALDTYVDVLNSLSERERRSRAIRGLPVPIVCFIVFVACLLTWDSVAGDLTPVGAVLMMIWLMLFIVMGAARSWLYWLPPNAGQMRRLDWFGGKAMVLQVLLFGAASVSIIVAIALNAVR